MCQRPVDRRSYRERLQELQEGYLKASHDALSSYMGKDKARIRYGRERAGRANNAYVVEEHIT
uniref:Uncharacterized protein n=1 Tax=viral metagenome TaxID=1070528 RepID=A0A6M3K3G9_9ZZZZ